MDLLNHPLVRKYFSWDIFSGHEDRIAKRVIDAMQQPIKKGDRCLQIAGPRYGVLETEAQQDMGDDFLTRFNFLRLPDHFQEQTKKELKCCLHGEACPQPSTKDIWATGDPVNERKGSSPYKQEDIDLVAYMKSRIEVLEAQMRCCDAENRNVHKENLNLERQVRSANAKVSQIR